jgi:hypothetical protein
MRLSQPFVVTPSQLKRPLVQLVMEHCELAQPQPVTFGQAAPKTEHFVLQEPQLFASFVTLTSQPFAQLESQSWKPDRHDCTLQMLPAQ